MASDDGSFITNPFPDDTPNLPPWGFGGNYGSIPSAPVTDLLSSIASVGLGVQAETEPRVATPTTQARQQEMSRLIMTERERYVAETNASEAGSIMENHMNGYMRGLEHGTNLNATQGSSIASPTTTGRVNNQSYLNLHGSLMNDKRRARTEQEIDVGGHINVAGHADVGDHIHPSDTQDQAVDDTAYLVHGSNVEGFATTQTNQPGISTMRRQPFFEEVAYPATSTLPAQNTYGQGGHPNQSNSYAAPPPPVHGLTNLNFATGGGQSDHARPALPPYVNEPRLDNVDSLNEPTTTNGRRQSNVSRLNESTPTNGQRQAHVGRLNEPSSTDRPQSDFGRLGQSTPANGQRQSNVGRLGRFLPLNRRAPNSQFRRPPFTNLPWPSLSRAQGYDSLGPLDDPSSTNRWRQPDVVYRGQSFFTRDQEQFSGGCVDQLSSPNDQDLLSGGPVQQPTSSNAQARIADQPENRLTIVNFPGVFGNITQVDHTTNYAGDELPVITSTGLNSHPTTYVTANHANGETNTGANGQAYDTRRDSHISENSSTSTLRRRAGVNDLSIEAENQRENQQEHGPFITLSTTPRGPPPAGLFSDVNHHATVESTPSSPIAAPIAPQPTPVAAAHPPDAPAPEVGFDLTGALHAFGTLRLGIRALGGSAAATDAVLGELSRATNNLVLGFRRAAAAASGHEQSVELLNRARLAARAIERQHQRATAAMERAEERAYLAERGGEIARADLAAARVEIVAGAAREVQLAARLAERRRECERLSGELAEMERVLFGLD